MLEDGSAKNDQHGVYGVGVCNKEGELILEFYPAMDMIEVDLSLRNKDL